MFFVILTGICLTGDSWQYSLENQKTVWFSGYQGLSLSMHVHPHIHAEREREREALFLFYPSHIQLPFFLLSSLFSVINFPSFVERKARMKRNQKRRKHDEMGKPRSGWFCTVNCMPWACACMFLWIVVNKFLQNKLHSASLPTSSLQISFYSHLDEE